jgi:hypothetical protein
MLHVDLRGVEGALRGIRQDSPRKRAARTRAGTPALPKGLLFGPDGAAFSPTLTRRGGRLDRRHVSQAGLPGLRRTATSRQNALRKGEPAQSAPSNGSPSTSSGGAVPCDRQAPRLSPCRESRGQPSRRLPKLFSLEPDGSECCLPAFTPDGTSLFIALHHPGELRFEDDADAESFDEQGKTWPDVAEGGPARPSVAGLTRAEGAAVGVSAMAAGSGPRARLGVAPSERSVRSPRRTGRGAGLRPG